jgi:predicted DNA-binding transcriptional regulator AlpA
LAKTPEDPFLSYAEVLAMLRVSRSTLHKWRVDGRFPAMTRLPNGDLRIRRSVLLAWLEDLPDA